MFRGAGILPVTPDGHILLQLRSHKEDNGGNTWGCFGGGISEDETFEQGAIREFCEETGSDPNKIDSKQLLGFTYRKDEWVEYRTFLLIVDEMPTTLPHVDANESSGYGWWDVNNPDTAKLPFFQPFLNTVVETWGVNWGKAILDFVSLYHRGPTNTRIVSLETAADKVKPVQPVKPVKMLEPTKETKPVKETEPVKEEKVESQAAYCYSHEQQKWHKLK